MVFVVLLLGLMRLGVFVVFVVGGLVLFVCVFAGFVVGLFVRTALGVGLFIVMVGCSLFGFAIGVGRGVFGFESLRRVCCLFELRQGYAVEAVL